MAKKIDIGSKEFSKLLVDSPYLPNQELIRQIDSKMFPLDQNKVFNHKPEQLAFKEFSRCLSLYQEKNKNSRPEQAIGRAVGIQSIITRTEAPYKEQLEALAIKTIKELYQVPDDIDLKAIINPKISLGTSQDHNPETFLELTLEQKNAMRDEIQKRIILNGLVHGSSMHVWKGLFHLVSEELGKINPNLKELYEVYTSSMGLYLWQLNPNTMIQAVQANVQMTQGVNRLNFNRDGKPGGTITAEAINFPVMLHELNKGVMDWIISAGIPKNYSEAELKYYYSKADTYEFELYHYLLSPTLWVSLLEVLQIDNKNIPNILSNITKLSYIELTDLFKAIIDDKIKAKEKIIFYKIL